MIQRKTKIVCTLGPSTEDDGVLRELMLSGMNVARLNFSHGNHEYHLNNINRIRRIAGELGKPVAIMLDTRGPEIRLELFENHKVELKKGQTFTLCTSSISGNAERASITYRDLPGDVREGTTILIDDGLVSMTVRSVTPEEIVCVVNNDGVVSDRKGINVPDVDLSMPYLSQKDREDIAFGVRNGIDFVAASFARTAEDMLEVRRLFSQEGRTNVNIIAKIENMQGVQN
ncbi:MAG: pyruvate kinase, partial [Clostridia bacterium]|nr:pyruvate kinase [Clostridia bacterium]